MELHNPTGLSGPRTSHYVCETCVKVIACVEVSPGIIPARIGCVFGCGKRMFSTFYIPLPDDAPPVPVTHEFYRPEGSELVQIKGHNHKMLMYVWRSGELWLRKRTEADTIHHITQVTKARVLADMRKKLDEVELFFTCTGLPRAKALSTKKLTLGG